MISITNYLSIHSENKSTYHRFLKWELLPCFLSCGIVLVMSLVSEHNINKSGK